MKSGMKSILYSIIAILVMISPAVAVNEIDKNTEANILAVEGLYSDGIDLEIDGIDKADILASTGGIELGADANNDTGFAVYNSGAVLDTVYFGDYISYIGNGSYALVPDYTDNPEVPSTYAKNFWIPLNTTASDLINADFLRLNFDSDQNYWIVAKNDITSALFLWQATYTENDTALFIPYLNVKSNLGNCLNSEIYLWIGGIQGTNGLDGEPVSFEFKLETFQLDAQDSLSIEDTSLYFLTIGIADVVLIVAFAFTTQQIDIKIDKDKPKKRR